MADPSSRPSLTVLAGPQTGARFVFDDAIDNVLIGSDPSCRFCLATPGVSPIHARIWIDAEGITVYDTNSPLGLYINDDRVTGHHVLRNGDVLWLGVPGDAESVMIQCVIPGAGEAPPAAVPQPLPVGEDAMKETVGFGAAPPAPPPVEPDVEFVETMIDTPATPEGDVFLVDDPLYQATTANLPAPKPVTEAEPVRFTVDLPTSATVPAAPALEVEIDETVIDAPAPPKVAPPPAPRVEPPPPAEPLPPPTSYPAPSPRAARPKPSPPPPAPAAPTAPKPRADRAVPAPRRRAPPPPAPVEPEEEGPAEAPGRAAAPLAKYALLVAGALVLGAVAFLAVRYFGAPSSENAGDAAQQPTAAAAPSVAPPAATPVPTAAPTQAPAVVEPIEEIITILQPKATPPPKPLVASSPSPAKAAAPTPAGAGKAATPPPEVARAQQLAAQVAGLLGQAEGAVSGRRYDAAVGFYDEVLKLDPQNAQATEGKARAQGALAAAKRAFVPGRTLVDSGKSAKADLGGFDTSDVKVSKAPDYSGRLDFEVTPARVQPGDNYSVKVYLTNDGKKSFKIGGLTATIAVNGAKSGGAGSPQVKEVDSQARVLLQDLPGVWQPDVKTWTLEVVVTTTHGETFRNTITWR